MKATNALAGEMIADDCSRELWLEFNRALGNRNFVRAVNLARQLGVAEERIRSLERDALKQFIAEYQNFEAAARLCADYCITAEELLCLVDEVLKHKELETQRTFAMRFGKAAHMSIAEQIREYARRQIELLKQGERHRAGEGYWKKLASVFKSWFNRWFNPWQGGFRPSGPTYG